MNEAVEDLTGGVSTIFVVKDILDVNKFWEDELSHVNEDRVFSCSFTPLPYPVGGAPPTVEGLYGNHAYSILRAVECRGKRFVVVRNPWGEDEWTGRWSDGSKEWTPEWLEILPNLRHTFGNDGQFVMEYRDFLRHFETIHRTFLFDDSWVLSSSWLAVPLNNHPRAWAYGALSYLVKLPSKSKTIFVLSRLNERSFRSIKKTTLIGLEYAVVRVGEREPIARACNHLPFTSRGASLELELEAGTYAVYVRFDRELIGGENKIGFDDTSDREWYPTNTNTRVVSRILSSKVESQAIASNWETKWKAVFIAKSLEQVIANDHERLKVLLGDGDNESRQTANANLGDDTLNGEAEDKQDSGFIDQVSKEVNGGNFDVLEKPSAPDGSETLDPALLSNLDYRLQGLLKLLLLAFLSLIDILSRTLKINMIKILKIDPKPCQGGTTCVGGSPSPEFESQGAHGNNGAAPFICGEKEATFAEGEETNSPSSNSPPTDEWRELLEDDGKTIFLGLRVYTQTEEPAHLTGRIQCEGPEICTCSGL